ncbi:MAG: flagellar assembly protein FliW [Armatimonadetes bacterium]|jgi:flagellar assembly factor FliW|nr:flagellar assembly protein FliW [Armatimonadota bacterium]
MRIETTRFGVVEVDESALVNIPGGLLGFEEQTKYCLIQHRPSANFRWLQSTQEPSLAFVVVDPSEYFADYEIELSDRDVQRLQLSGAEDAIILTILTIRDSGSDVSANLAAPIVINSKNLIAAQVVLEDERYQTRHVLATAQNKHIAAA